MKKLLFLVILTVFAVSLYAQAESKPEISQPSEDLAALQLANNLARYGYDTESASALIGAAEIMAQVQTQALGAEGTHSEARPEQAAQEFDAAKLIADARRFAGNDQAMIAWATQVERALNTRTRGAVGGPREGWDIVGPGGTVTFNISFRANELAEVLVLGDGSTILDIFVYDNNGNLITRTDVYTSDAYTSWVPRWTGAFSIVVRNWGNRRNVFEIYTN